ncbi:MAG TPA: signal peptidase I [Acidimicrobiales bacterium]|nr:signal peptidase I [Acidimicrobiales bacterium]
MNDDTSTEAATTEPAAATPEPAAATTEPAAATSEPAAAPDPGTAAAPRRAPTRSSLRRRRTVEWLVVAACAVLVALALRGFVVQTFFVPSGSMLPTLQIGDRMLVDKLPWVVDSIQRGDIIVFHRTPADTSTNAGDLVKRVIGLPGETITSKGDTVYIDGRPLAEPWLPALVGQCAQPALDIPRTTIAAGHYFVLGDCRGNSEDSRYWGTVPQSYIVGKVFVVVWRHGHPWFHWF